MASFPTSAPPTATHTWSNLFPTTTAASATATSSGSGSGASVYYLVVLGVIIVLLLLAGSLTLRAWRLRRRYRTARQRAIARGEPVSLWPGDERDDFWGFAALDALGRRGARAGEAAAGRKKRKGVGRAPVIWDAAVEKLGDEGDEGGEGDEGYGGRRGGAGADDDGDGDGVGAWFGVQPLTVHSLSATLAAPGEPPADVRPTFAVPSRRRGVADPELAGGTGGAGGPTTPLSEAPPAPAPAPGLAPVEPGEPVRVAVIVRMPVEGGPRGDVEDDDDDDDEERVGWEAGMELGVWEGVVGARGE